MKTKLSEVLYFIKNYFKIYYYSKNTKVTLTKIYFYKTLIFNY